MRPGVMFPGFPESADDPIPAEPEAICWNDPKSRPAQNDDPSPDSTTARTADSDFSRSPADASAENIAPSSALRLSGRFRRTSATPPETSIDTRSSFDMSSSWQSPPERPQSWSHDRADFADEPTRATSEWQTSRVQPTDSASEDESRRETPRVALMVGLCAAAVGAVTAAVQLRHGIIPLLDTVTYWSGAESVASGHPWRTTLAPSFSNFDAVEFLDRGGSIPFVDFPIAYPLIAGSAGVVIGTRAAMHLLAVIAIALTAWAIVSGASSCRTSQSPGWSRSPARSLLLGAFACLVPILPAMRLVTQGTLSEPLFIASTLLLVGALARYRNGGSWSPVVVLIVTSSLLRFLGAPLAVLAGWEHHRRTGRAGQSIAWTITMMTPAAINIAAASAAGGGHSAGWRGLDRLDVEVFVRSVGGWFDAIQGDIRRTYFTTDGPSWWSWPATVAVVVMMALAMNAVIRRRRLLTDTADIALAAAAILTGGLVAGILGFDALVIADNRLMLPIGILVMSAMVWTGLERLTGDEFSFTRTSNEGNSTFATRSSRATRSRMTGVGAFSFILIVWGIAGVRPWNALERFSDVERPIALSQSVVDLDIAVVITNDADGVHWDTGLPAAYTPMPVKPLTGDLVDDVAIYQRIPCPLLRAQGAIVISNDATFSTVNREALGDLAERGVMREVMQDRATVYLPTDRACGE